jgi:hypothetical protein
MEVLAFYNLSNNIRFYLAIVDDCWLNLWINDLILDYFK